MLEIEIDGKKVEVPDGSTVMDAAHKVGTYIPHFCYHKKLSIAANCRMCLVDVEKAPKALPACATPVTNGMKVATHSDKAVKAQKSVMEFLLINHPLDCPICDQGGECQLQDLAVGYGGSASRYKEEKRVVFNKNLGPLISTDMTRCIHCTRCVRFGQEIAGIMELGMAGRGEHSEILSFVGRTVNSEISGNVIDLCPVGALTSKPFRFSARTWEMARRKSVSPHDSLGSNLIVQVKLDRVKRVLPLENESINECWLSDKDRFSYDGLYAEDRVTQPMIKQGGQWREVDWQTALIYAADALKGVSADHGAQNIGALLSPHSTLEELYLAQKLMRGIGSNNVDFRLRQSDFALDGKLEGAPWLGMPVAELNQLDSVLVIGSFLRKDHPLVAQRLRQAVRAGGRMTRIHSVSEDWLTVLDGEIIVAPSEYARALAEVLAAVAAASGKSVSAECVSAIAGIVPSDVAKQIAGALVGEKRAILLGNLAVQHPNYATLHVLAQELARLTGAHFGVLGEAANSVGGYIAQATPGSSGKNAREMIAEPLKAYLILGAEVALDTADGAAALNAVSSAETVIYLGAFGQEAAQYADVILPCAPFSETSGTFINAEGRAQSFHAVAKALGEARPAWKVLRVLANLLDVPGFDYDSSEAVRTEVIGDGDVVSALSNKVSGVSPTMGSTPAGLQRVADVPIYFADPLVRRAEPLQKTFDAKVPRFVASSATLTKLGLQGETSLRVRSASGGQAVLEVELHEGMAVGTARVSAAHASTLALGPMFGELSVERA